MACTPPFPETGLYANNPISTEVNSLEAALRDAEVTRWELLRDYRALLSLATVSALEIKSLLPVGIFFLAAQLSPVATSVATATSGFTK